MERILAVDDDHVILTLISKALEKEGYIIDTFLNSPEALKELENKKYDIIISDLMMPEIDGEAFYRHARALQPRVPFVFLTAHDDLATAVRIMKMGADDYLQKPFKGEELAAAISKASQGRKEEQFIRKTMEDNLLDRSEQEGIFSWKQLYSKKDTEQTNRIMGVLSRNIEQGGGFMWLDMLKKELDNQDEEFEDLIVQRSVLNHAVESAEYMRKIITDLNFISTFHQMDFPMEKVGLEAFQDQLTDFYSRELIPIAVAHNRKISLNLPDIDLNYSLEIHRENLFKSLKEMLCNAVKYSPEESKIILLLHIREESGNRILEISLWNSPKETMTRNPDGETISGIPYEHSESVFELFYTFESFPVHIPEEEWSQGTGLYIVRKMIEKMQGDMEARNIVMHTPQKAVPYVKVTISLLLDKIQAL